MNEQDILILREVICYLRRILICTVIPTSKVYKILVGIILADYIRTVKVSTLVISKCNLDDVRNVKNIDTSYLDYLGRIGKLWDLRKTVMGLYCYMYNNETFNV